MLRDKKFSHTIGQDEENNFYHKKYLSTRRGSIFTDIDLLLKKNNTSSEFRSINIGTQIIRENYYLSHFFVLGTDIRRARDVQLEQELTSLDSMAGH